MHFYFSPPAKLSPSVYFELKKNNSKTVSERDDSKHVPPFYCTVDKSKILY